MIIVGCGYTGRRLAQCEAAAGRPCTGIVSSSASRARLAPLGLDVAVWDLDRGGPPPPLDYRDAIVYLVPPARDAPDDPRLARLLRELPARPSRVVYVSTTGVYGDHGGAVVDESMTPTPRTARAERRLAAETTLRAWSKEHAVPWVVLRAPGIYGPDRLQLATLASDKPMLRPGDAGPGNRIHVDDLVRCLQAAVTTPHAGREFNVGDGNPMSNTQFVALVAAQMGVTAPPQADRDLVEAAAGQRRWSFLRESRQVDTARMRTLLGVTPRYLDPGDGIAASLDAMRKPPSGEPGP